MEEGNNYPIDIDGLLLFQADELYEKNVQMLVNFEHFSTFRKSSVQKIILLHEDYKDQNAIIDDPDSAYEIAKIILGRLITEFSVGPVVFKRNAEGSVAYWLLQIGQGQCYLIETAQNITDRSDYVIGLPIQAIVTTTKPEDYDELLRAQTELSEGKNSADRQGRIKRLGHWLNRLADKIFTPPENDDAPKKWL